MLQIFWKAAKQTLSKKSVSSAKIDDFWPIDDQFSSD